MSAFFSKILYFAVGMFKAYFLIGIAVALLELIIIILFSVTIPEDYKRYFNDQFAELANHNDPKERLMPWEVTAGDRVFLTILILIASCLIWPYVLSILFERNPEE